MKNSYFGEIFNGATYVFAALQTNEIFQTIQLCLSIVTSLVLIAFRLWKWYKTAKADGVITIDEIEEGENIITEGKKEIEKKGKDEKDDGKIH